MLSTLAVTPAGEGKGGETPPMSVATVTTGRVLVLVTGMGESLPSNRTRVASNRIALDTIGFSGVGAGVYLRA